jgi:hypothetical protein
MEWNYMEKMLLQVVLTQFLRLARMIDDSVRCCCGKICKASSCLDHHHISFQGLVVDVVVGKGTVQLKKRLLQLTSEAKIPPSSCTSIFLIDGHQRRQCVVIVMRQSIAGF